MKKVKKMAAMAAAMSLTYSFANASCASMDSLAVTKNGDKVVSYAESLEGKISGSPNIVTHMWDFYEYAAAWCHMFIYYCAAQNNAADNISFSSYCDNQHGGIEGGIQFYERQNRYFDKWVYPNFHPERADLIYFDSTGDHKADHVGFVTWADNTYVYTVEGNAGDEETVKCNRYYLTDPTIMGYATPDYGDDGSIIYSPIQSSPSSSAVSSSSTSSSSASSSSSTSSSGSSSSNSSSNSSTSSSASYVGENSFTLSSSIGGWLRSSAAMGDNKIGIVSTGTVLNSDYNFGGEWYHFNNVPVEGTSQLYSGWISATNLTANFTSGNTPTYTPVQSPAPDTSASAGSVYISSEVGAWFRSDMSFGDYNKICILDTYQQIDICATYGDWYYAGAYVNGAYSYGYVHQSTVSCGYGTAETPAAPTYSQRYIDSPIGANFRSDPEFSDYNILAVLNAYDIVEVQSIYGEWAFVTATPYGYTMYGYVHTSVLSD